MKAIRRGLPVASIAIVLALAGFYSSASGWAGTAKEPSIMSEAADAVTPEDIDGARPVARTPAQLLKILGERIKAKDVDGIVALQESEAAIVNYDKSVIRGRAAIRAFYVEWFKSDPVLTVNPKQTVIAGGKRAGGGTVRNRTASIMGEYTLEQTRADGTRESFSGNFCDTVQEQSNGTWLYVQDNPYPPHGDGTPAHH
ncbi:YybH family protein [Kitasatospora sp. NPDC048286]|uniref:YybH family protein n=1 Tax=Kitasatospora sp. NPDC048286 TaxID=3364047 RepID=UPI00371D5A40